jgi:Putative DNA-binding domain
MMATTSAYGTLAAQQDQLLAQIFAVRSDTPSRGLSAYRANAHASAERALSAVYPVVAQLLGEENFAFLARDFWHQHPPQRGDLAQWGQALAEFAGTAPQLQEHVFLADVARIEWALHVCASAQDAGQDLPSFALLSEHVPEQVRLQVAPGTCVLHSDYPAAAICLSHLGEGSLDDAVALLHAGTEQTALVWRQGFVPRLALLPASEKNFMTAVCQGASLASALNHANTDFDFGNWLTASVQSGLVLGAYLITLSQ